MAKKISTQYDHLKIPIIGLVAENKSTAPTSPVNGQLYYDTTNLRGYIRENGAWVEMSRTGSELTANKGVAGGYASLDGTTKVPIAQIPTGITSSTVPFGNDARFTDQRVPTDGSVTGGTAGAGVKIAASTITLANLAASLLSQPAGTESLRQLGFGAANALAGTTRLDQIAAPTAPVTFNSQELTNLGAPLSASSAARLSDVQAASAGIDNKPSVRLVATAQRALTGLTAIDGVTPVAGNRILLTGQTAPAENGSWVAAAGAWSRTTDTITSGSFWMAEEGTTFGASQWKVSTPDPIVVGTTALTINQFGAASVYIGTANRITVTGSAIDISSAYVGQATITTLGTVAIGTWQSTAIGVLYGGTGATTASGARTNLSSTTNALPQKYTTTYTTAIVAGTPFTVTHNLNTQAVTVSLRNTSTNEHEDFLIVANGVNTIQVTSDVAYASPSYEITVIG